jgi:hypothetical protein
MIVKSMTVGKLELLIARCQISKINIHPPSTYLPSHVIKHGKSIMQHHFSYLHTSSILFELLAMQSIAVSKSARSYLHHAPLVPSFATRFGAL